MRMISNEDVENIGHALSTIIQTRYVWLFNHISRAEYLEIIDNPEFSIHKRYAFAQEDIDNGKPPIETGNIITLLRKSDTLFADTKDGIKYDFDYIRDITRTGLRISYLVSIQTCLETYRTIDICKKYSFPEKELFDFIRQARNIICHANGIMNSNRLIRCQWREMIIENNGEEFRMPDFALYELVDEAITFLAKLYIENGKQIDPISYNLGYTVPYIKSLETN